MFLFPLDTGANLHLKRDVLDATGACGSIVSRADWIFSAQSESLTAQ